MKEQVGLAGRLLRVNEVLQLVPIGRSTWWVGVREGRFPKPVKLSPRVTCWRGEDIEDLIRSATRGQQ